MMISEKNKKNKIQSLWENWFFRGQRSGQVEFNLYRKSKVGGECAERLKPRPKCQIQSLWENWFFRGQRSGQVKFNLYRKSKVGGECAERLKPRPKCQIQSVTSL